MRGGKLICRREGREEDERKEGCCTGVEKEEKGEEFVAREGGKES